MSVLCVYTHIRDGAHRVVVGNSYILDGRLVVVLLCNATSMQPPETHFGNTFFYEVDFFFRARLLCVFRVIHV